MHPLPSYEVQQGLSSHPRIRNVIAVGSGKGGVGKSTITVNLALTLQALGAKVGILDADVYGPSVPTMLGLHHSPEISQTQQIIPLRAFGLEAMSIGFLVDKDTPMIWRGPMATSALQQMFNQTHWDNLDCLLVDLPPGTGDIQLSLAQKIPLAGAVVVTTPQDVATADARKALQMFEKLHIPVLGIVENMAMHICAQCGHTEHIFGEGGGEQMASQYHVKLLGRLPLQKDIRMYGDQGEPIVHAAPNSTVSVIYRSIAENMLNILSKRPRARIPIVTSPNHR